MCFFHAVGNKAPSLFFNSVLAAAPFWGLSTHGDFPFRFSLPPTQLVISPGLPPPFSFPPLPLMEWLGFGPPHCHQRVLLLLPLPPCLHTTRVSLPSRPFAQRALAERGKENWDSYSSLFAASCCEEKSVARGWLLSPADQKLAKLYTLEDERKTAKGGDREIFCFFKS